MLVRIGIAVATQLGLYTLVAAHSGDHAQIPVSSDASWAERHMAGQFRRRFLEANFLAPALTAK